LLGSSAVARRASPRAVASVASIFRDLESFQTEVMMEQKLIA
jgi:hypothetical protein